MMTLLLGFFGLAQAQQSLPYTEGFESGMGSWTMSNCHSSTGVSTTSNYVHSGSSAFVFHWYTQPPQYLISPELTGAEAGLDVEFYYKAGGVSFSESFQVGYSTTTNATSAFTFEAEITAPGGGAWTAYNATFPAGTKYVAVKCTSYDKFYFCVDDFTFTAAGGNAPSGQGDQLHVKYEAEDGTEVIDTLNLGVRPVGAWMEPFRFTMYSEGPTYNVTVLDFTPNDGMFSVEGQELPFQVAPNGDVDLTMAINGTQAGIIERQFVAITEGNRAAHIWPVTVELYSPECPDVVEVAYDFGVVEPGFSYVGVPADITPTTLHDDYTLPFPEIPEGVDAVYKLTFEQDQLLNAYVSQGENGKVALYTEDFYGEGGPMAHNYYQGPGIGGSGSLPFEAMIGDESSTTTNSYFPFHVFFKYSIGENLFLASELAEAGVTTAPMTSLSWYVDNTTCTQEQNNISIWMANVEDTEIPTSSHNTTGMTLVYTGSGLPAPVVGWNEFVLNGDSFAWDGVSNVLIVCQRNNGAYQGRVNWRTHNPGFYAQGYNYTDGTAYDLGTTSYTLTRSNTNRANIIMKGGGRSNRDLTVGFESGLPAGWTTIDADGDGHNWIDIDNFMNEYSYYTGMTPDWYHGGSNAMLSASYINVVGALAPDNYLVSPQVTLGAGSSISFWMAAADESYPTEHFGVFVSDNGTSNWTMVQEWTMTAKSGGRKTDARATRDGNSLRIGNWYNYTVDLSAYTGQKYVAIRHFNSYDQYILCLDDVTIVEANANPDPTPTPGGAISAGPVIENLPVTPGTYYLVASSTDPDFEVTINAEQIPCPAVEDFAFGPTPPDDYDEAEPASVTLHWNIPPYATGWRLVFGSTYHPQPGHPQTIMYPADGSFSNDLANSFTVRNLWNNTNYFWHVEFNNDGCPDGVSSPIWGFTTHLNIPNNLRVVDETIFEGEDAVLLWDAVVDRTYRMYNVYQDGQLIGHTTVNDISDATYTVSGLAYNMQGYTFQVSAVYDEGESALSDPVVVKVSGEGEVNGHVYEQDGTTGIAGATVTFNGTDEFGVTQTYTFITNAQGYYSGSMYVGSYNGQAGCEGYQTVTAPVQGNPVVIAHQTTTSPIDFILDEDFTALAHVCAELVEVDGEELVKVWWDFNFFTTLTENFEDWDNTPYAWQNDATYPWALTTEAHEGTYAFKSGNTGVHSSTSTLQVTVEIPQDGQFSFDLWARGESTTDTYDWDVCRFFFDGQQMFQYGQHSGWETFSMPITAGSHSFSWVYKKDGSVHPSAGDCFIIDNIVFVGGDDRGGERALNHYRIYRTDCYNDGPYTEENTVLLATAWRPDTAYIDVSWPQAAPGVYKWGVGVVYEGNRGEMVESTINWVEPVNVNTDNATRDGFTYGFEGGLDGWTVIDVNTSGGTWLHSNNNPGGYDYTTNAHSGSGFAMCYSFIDFDGAYNTDSYLVSPQKYSITNNSSVTFYADNANDNYPESFSVCVATADNPSESDFTTVWSGNAKGNEGGKANYRHDGNRYNNWREHNVDLSAYAGQEVWIAFHDVNYDAYEIWIDDVTINADNAGNGDIPGTNINYLALPRESETIWSNMCSPCIDKDMELEGLVTVNVLLNSADSPEGTVVTFTNLNEGEQLYHPIDPITLDSTGHYIFESFRKGDYAIEVAHAGYETINDTVSIWEARDLRYVMIEILYGIDNLYVSRTGWAMWEGQGDTPVPVIPDTEFTFGFEEDLATNGWTIQSLNATTWVREQTTGFNAVPHEGQWQMWLHWDYGDQNEWLITPEFAVPSNANLQFWTFGQMGSTYGDHYYVKVSADGGSTWTELWDASAQPNMENHYSTPVNVDLNAYAGQNVKLAWQGYAVGGLWYAWCIDDVTVSNGREVISFDGRQWLRKPVVATEPASALSFCKDETRDSRHLEYYKVMCTSVDGEPIFNANTEHPFCQLATDELVEGEQYICKVAAVYSTGQGPWSEVVWQYESCEHYTGTVDGVTIEGNTISWTYPEGGDDPNPPTPPTGDVTVILTAGDNWGDGSGYQMLLDADANAYGSTIPETGPLSSFCSGNEAIYAEFEYKIPVNADGNCSTQNIVFNNSISITIPAGTYDWCITNPTPGDRIWIAAANGNVGGRQNDYVFEAGKTYEFTVTRYGSNDGVDVVITDNGKVYGVAGSNSVVDNSDCRFEEIVPTAVPNATGTAPHVGNAYYKPAQSGLFRGATGYANCVYNMTWPNAYVSFDVDAPATVNNIASVNVNRGGDYAGGFFYGYNADGVFFKINYETGAIVEQHSTSYTAMTEMAFNYADNTMYGIDNSSTGNSQLVTIDLATGNKTPIGGLGVSIMAFAIDLQGNAYGISITDGNFYSIDLATATKTQLGNTGHAVNYVQCMNFDHNTETLYWFQISDINDCALYTVNTLTGATTMLMNTPGEVTSFFVPFDGQTPPEPVGNILGAMIFVDGEWEAFVPAPTNTYTYEGDGNEVCVRMVHDGTAVLPDNNFYYAMSCEECVEFNPQVACNPGAPIYAEALNETDQVKIYWGEQEPEPQPTEGDTFAFGFENGFEGWTTIDNDGDGLNWVNSANSVNASGYDYSGLAHGGNYFVYSQSFIDYDGPYNADNYLVTPQKYAIVNGSTLTFWADNANDSYPDHIEVCVATADNPVASDFTMVWSHTGAKSGANAEVRHDGNRYENWRQHIVDLSAYAGQNVWIAFHHQDYDMYEIWIDDVELSIAGKNRDGIVKYNVYRSADNDNYELIAEVPAVEGQTYYEYIDTPAAGTYYYQVRADYGDCESEPAVSGVNPDVNYVTAEVTGIDELDNVALYPNPTNSNVTIEAAGMRHITVMSVLGQVVYDAEVNSDQVILNMSQYNVGVYVVRIVTANGVGTRRVTVVR